jgi:hypothetical protein
VRRQTIDVFQVSSGRRIFRERLVGRFRAGRGSFTWNGRANRPGRRVTDGFYFVRARIPGIGVSRLVLARRHGRFRRQPDFFLTGTCGVLAFAKLQRPVFGGAQRYPLRLSYRVGKAAKVRLVIRRGNEVVRTFGTHRRRANRTYRAKLGLRGLPKGLYSATLRVTRGKRTVVTTLAARRI